MLEKLQYLANKIRVLFVPAILIGLISLGVILFNLFLGNGEQHQFVMLGFIGLLWSISTYSFIGTFRATPEKANNDAKFLFKTKRKLVRLWYWLIGLAFLATSLLIVSMSFRLLSIWLSDFT